MIFENTAMDSTSLTTRSKGFKGISRIKINISLLLKHIQAVAGHSCILLTVYIFMAFTALSASGLSVLEAIILFLERIIYVICNLIELAAILQLNCIYCE